MLDSILQKDKALLVFLNNLGSSRWDGFWLFITDPFHWIPLFLFILFLIFRTLPWKKGLLLLLTTTLMVAFSDQFTNFIRVIFERLRPCNDPNIQNAIRILFCPSNYSFTSGHATTSTAFSIFVILSLKNNYRYIKCLWLFPLVFAYSRIYLGVHFPLDIICGAIIGSIIGVSFYKIYIFTTKKWSNILKT